MKISVSFDKASGVPVYRQLAESVKRAVSEGALKPLDKLPSERELSSASGVSRGTVKKAYESLVQEGVIYVSRGAGTFVGSGMEDADDACAIGRADKFIGSMLSSGYTLNETKSLLDYAIKRMAGGTKRVSVAVIECNPEALEIIERQISSMNNIIFVGFLLSEVTDFKKADSIFSSFDFILTTSTHYPDIISLIPKRSKKLIKAVLSPDFNTIVGLKAIPKDASVGIITRSARFAYIIEHNLKSLNCGFKAETLVLSDAESCGFETEILVLSDEGTGEIKRFFREKSFLIIPPANTLTFEDMRNDELSDYYKRGGNMVAFNYTIEKGSLIYLEEKALGIST